MCIPPFSLSCLRGSDDALCHHGAGDFHEACDVGSLDVVDVAVGFLAVVCALLVYAVHYLVEACVDFLGCP